MKNRIACHLEHTRPDQSTPVSWALFDSEGHTLTQGVTPLGQVREMAGKDAEKAEVHAYVSGMGVMLTEVSIPSRQTAHLRKALPFMIEDQLVGELRQTHLAVAPTRYGDSVPVAVVSHDQMINWLDCMHKAGLVPSAVVPEQLLVPREAGSVCVHVHGQRALVRLGDCRGVTVAPENLALILELALSQRAMPCSRIEIATSVACGEDIELADKLGKELGERLDRPILRTNYKETLVELLAKSARGPLPILNLCQGGYRVDSRAGQSRASWLPTWITAAACLAIFAMTCFGAGSYLESRAEATHDETLALFHRMFPDERRVTSLRRQAESRLASSSGTGTGPLVLMAKLASSLTSPEVAGTGLQSLRYKADDATLSADVKAQTLAQINRLSQLLGESGIDTKVMAGSEEGGIASARLEMRAL